MPTIRRPGRMPSRAVLVTPAVLLVSVAVVTLVAACGTDTPSSRPTVTVYVDPPSPATPTSTASTTSVPTIAAEPTTAAVPTALAVGRQKGAPHSYAEARARIAGAPAGAAAGSFQSPSGNIVCHLGGAQGLAACEVGTGRATSPLPTLCPAGGPKDIGRIELRAAGAQPVCNSDTIRDGGEPKLAYGSRTTALDPVACLSEEAGVTCVDSGSRHGFFLARNTFVTF